MPLAAQASSTTLRVEVRDQLTLAPLEGASVCIRYDGPHCEARWNVKSSNSGDDQDMLVSDAGGVATLRLQLCQDLWVSVGGFTSKPGTELRSTFIHALREGEERRIVVGVRTLPDRVVYGRVVRAEDLAPLAGLDVAFGSPWSPNDPATSVLKLRFHPTVTCTTNRHGEFEALVRSWEPLIAFAGSETLGARFSEVPVGTDLALRLTDFQLSPAAELEVTLQAPASLDLRSCTLRVEAALDELRQSGGAFDASNKLLLDARTDWRAKREPSGSFRLRSLPARVPLSLVLERLGREVARLDDLGPLYPGEVRRQTWSLDAIGEPAR
jgi:hypothetical protein